MLKFERYVRKRDRVARLSIIVSILVLISANSVFTQDSTQKEKPDTLRRRFPINRSLLHGFDTLGTIPSTLRKPPIYAPWYIRQSLINLPPSLSYQYQQEVDVVSPWEAELARDNELRTLKILLQAVSAGGTAYILYEHIRKNGLE
jgi:hypothetical protein